MVANALSLLGGGPPKWDLVGPTVDDDVRRAIQRYGAEAVKAALKEATKLKWGRRREPDWPELRDIFQDDAREWLAGGDPLASRSNYAIANAFAERNPGHSVVSTAKRIVRKLGEKPHDRRWFMLAMAEDLSRDGYPYMAHIRTLDALASLPSVHTASLWQTIHEQARATISDFEAREGKSPDESMSFREVEEAVLKGGMAALIGPPKSIGLFKFAQPIENRLGKILQAAVEAPTDGEEKGQ